MKFIFMLICSDIRVYQSSAWSGGFFLETRLLCRNKEIISKNFDPKSAAQFSLTSLEQALCDKTLVLKTVTDHLRENCFQEELLCKCLSIGGEKITSK